MNRVLCPEHQVLIAFDTRPACKVGDAEDAGLIPGWGRSPGVGHGNPLQYSCLENPLDRGAWRATVHGGGKESDRTEQVTLTWIMAL